MSTNLYVNNLLTPYVKFNVDFSRDSWKNICFYQKVSGIIDSFGVPLFTILFIPIYNHIYQHEILNQFKYLRLFVSPSVRLYVCTMTAVNILLAANTHLSKFLRWDWYWNGDRTRAQHHLSREYLCFWFE